MVIWKENNNLWRSNKPWKNFQNKDEQWFILLIGLPHSRAKPLILSGLFHKAIVKFY